MAVKVDVLESGKSRISLEGEPANCHALEMAPTALEPMLRRGRWLVYCFAVWSTPDRIGVRTALEFMRQRPRPFELGLRPFNSHTEFEPWCPLPDEAHFRSPIWVRIEQGRVLGVDARQPTHEQMDALLGDWVG